MKKSLMVLLFLSVCATLTFGHSGRTDANGGHYNRKTGTYHYHNGGKSSTPSEKAKTSETPKTTISSSDVGSKVHVIQDANLRTGPGSTFEILKVIKKDSYVTILSVEGNWANVESEELFAGTAWISTSLLRTEK
ncbi:YHYH domain-containing protein [Treponema zuelzerae]|uniref:YHYH domain-containing protein n=1 Tax=Teretinema zuelzerae TaxID=156 RepID=A0AAE3EGE8_9SPIR|nr:YHYH domain-containing protein [Teretinema zuelzerae]MCD1653106.1 YHYH domain-containing protein [Teretinema zuelzerae]MCD1654455.1 YHYH domain-containing protein [Teretinema zuelzerae]MCD1656197.1 YHYH domain-containing protein [Teretinema zuelzerae]